MDKEELVSTEEEDSRELLPYAPFLQALKEALKEMKEEETMVESRYTDQTIVKCHTCGWTGKVADCRHGYTHSIFRGCFNYDATTPQDYCPVCDSIDLENEEVPNDSNTA